MNRMIVWIGMTGLCFQPGFLTSASAEQITSLNFRVDGANSIVDIQGDKPLTYEKRDNTADQQVIMEFKGATISPSVNRPLDTSSFNSPVSLISPYQVETPEKGVKLVMQLKQPSSSTVTQDGNQVKLILAAGDAPPAALDAPPGSPPPPPAASDAAVPAEPPSAPAVAALPPTRQASTPEEKMDAFFESQKTRIFIGSHITLQFRETDLADVFRLISDSSGFNIVLGDGVSGKISLSLIDVPWDQGLDVILQSRGLGAERNQNVLRIMTLENLTKEKKAQFEAKKASEQVAPRVTKLIPVNYADPTALQTILKTFGSATSAASGGATSQAVIQFDSRTNTMIVQDITENVERMKKLIELLDKPVPQVLIEAKIIETTEINGNYREGLLGFVSKGAAYNSLGGNYKTSDFSNGGVDSFAAFNGAEPMNNLVGDKMPSPLGGGILGLQPGLGFLGQNLRLFAQLKLLESENKAKQIGSPRAVVLNRESVNIMQTTPTVLQKSTLASNGQTTTEQVPTDATVSLVATPVVTNAGSVLLDLTLNRDIPIPLPGGGQGVGKRSIKTKVLIDSGSTLVLGGVYTERSSHKEEGFPILRNIPLIGWLFGFSDDSHDRVELFFFITPRILAEKEAGLSS